jgi:hypothetical protein
MIDENLGTNPATSVSHSPLHSRSADYSQRHSDSFANFLRRIGWGLQGDVVYLS